MTKLTIATRGSALALWQARFVASEIEKVHPNLTVQLKIIKTQGDKILDTPLAKIGTKGLFTKEIEEALLANEADVAVHSMKDLPTDLPVGLKLAVVVKREDPRDVFISRDGRQLEEIGPGEKIGTSSLRRRAFLLIRFPTLDVVSIRGNVETRIRKIQSENLAGVILAAAGVKRMQFAEKISAFLDTDFMIPAIGQGALAIETRENDPETETLIKHLNDEQTARCVLIERAFLRRMGGGCQVPMAAHAIRKNGRTILSGAVVHPDGTEIIKHEIDTESLSQNVGTDLADQLISMGAERILREVFPEGWTAGPAS
jgi:hydroxymethylbilane synthase